MHLRTQSTGASARSRSSKVLRLPVVGRMLKTVGELITQPLRLLGYLYLLRVPFLIGVVMLAIPVLSWMGPLRSLTVGAYDVRLDDSSSNWIFLRAYMTSLVFILASAGINTIAAVFSKGVGKRFGKKAYEVSEGAHGWWILFVILSVGLNIAWMTVASWLEETGLRENWMLVAAPIAALATCAFLGGLGWLSRTPVDGAPAVPADGKPKEPEKDGFFAKLFHWLLQGGLLAWLERKLQGGSLSKNLAELYHATYAGHGILKMTSADPDAEPLDPPELEEGQGRLTVYTFLITVVFVLVIAFVPVAQAVSPVAALFLLFTVLVYVLFLLTFWLDHYRVPLPLFLVGCCTFMNLWRESDHFYAIKKHQKISIEPGEPFRLDDEKAYRDATNQELGLPAQLLGRPFKDESGTRPLGTQTVVVIAMAGGGIQAAAWPVAALEEIEAQYPGFHRHVRVISGVSGGSVGAMYYARAYPQEKGGPFMITAAKKSAMSSSLAPVTMAILRHDLRKVTFPLTLVRPLGNPLKDRGLALEDAFSMHAGKQFNHKNEPDELLQNATLASWGADALALKRPALILNGTVVETGERIAFSTIPRRASAITPGMVEFTHRYYADIAIPTAARLSATFPGVSPAARPAVEEIIESPKDGKQPREISVDVVPGLKHWKYFPNGGSFLHVVDGGYFENSAVAGALAWLQEGLEQLNRVSEFKTQKGVSADRYFKMPQRVIFLEMSGFPDPFKPGAVDAGGRTSGAVFDLTSPALTVVNIREGIQAAFPNEVINLFKQRWADKLRLDHIKLNPKIEKEEWTKPVYGNPGFLPHKPPLSWHLRECEKQGIENTMGTLRDQLSSLGEVN